jgi:hypothetical protein
MGEPIAQHWKTSGTPVPILADASKICIPERTLSMFRRAAATSATATAAMKLFVGKI